MKRGSREHQTIRRLFSELMRSPRQKFPLERQRLQAPKGRGVYVIYNGRGIVVHVGRTPRARGGIAQRLKNHMAAASSFTLKYLNGDGSKLRGKYSFRCLMVENARHCALLEAYATGQLCPAHIGVG